MKKYTILTHLFDGNADTKITDLTAYAPVAVSDVLPIVDLANGITKKALVSEIIKKAVQVSASLPAQALSSGDTYITGSNVTVSGRLQVGTIIRWKVVATKTAAGVATPIFIIRFGTAGTVADTARVTFTMPAQTAAADTGVFDVMMVVTTIGASGVVFGSIYVNHVLAVTGFSISTGATQVTSGTFDTTVVGLIAGLSVNVGASGAWTVTAVVSELINSA